MKKVLALVLSAVLSVSAVVTSVSASASEELRYGQKDYLFDGKIAYDRTTAAIMEMEIHGVKLHDTKEQVDAAWGGEGEELGGGWYLYRQEGMVPVLRQELVYDEIWNDLIRKEVPGEVPAQHAVQIRNDRVVGIYTSLVEDEIGSKLVTKESWRGEYTDVDGRVYEHSAHGNLLCFIPADAEYLIKNKSSPDIEGDWRKYIFDDYATTQYVQTFNAIPKDAVPKDSLLLHEILSSMPFAYTYAYQSFESLAKTKQYNTRNDEICHKYIFTGVNRYTDEFTDEFDAWYKEFEGTAEYKNYAESLGVTEYGWRGMYSVFIGLFYPEVFANLDLRTINEYYEQEYGHSHEYYTVGDSQTDYNPLLIGTPEMTFTSVLFDILWLTDYDMSGGNYRGSIYMYEAYLKSGWGFLVPHFNNWR